MHGRWLETLHLWKERRTVFGTTSWRRTFESGIFACFTPFHPGSRFFGESLGGCCLVFCVGFVFCVCFCFGWLPTISRCRSFLPDLMTVRSVMVRAAMEKKTQKQNQSKHPNQTHKTTTSHTSHRLQPGETRSVKQS